MGINSIDVKKRKYYKINLEVRKTFCIFVKVI